MLLRVFSEIIVDDVCASLTDNFSTIAINEF